MSVTLLEPGTSAPPVEVWELESLYEIINGQRVELPPMSALAIWTTSQLVGRLWVFNAVHDFGHPVTEMLFRLPLATPRNRRPDGAFVTYNRWAKGRLVPTENAWDVVPDLAIEVTSPTDLADEIMQKIMEYFQAGVRLVWLVYPQQQLVYVYESPTQVRGLTRNDELDGGPVLPGFRLSLAELFPEGPSAG